MYFSSLASCFTVLVSLFVLVISVWNCCSWSTCTYNVLQVPRTSGVRRHQAQLPPALGRSQRAPEEELGGRQWWGWLPPRGPGRPEQPGEPAAAEPLPDQINLPKHAPSLLSCSHATSIYVSILAYLSSVLLTGSMYDPLCCYIFCTGGICANICQKPKLIVTWKLIRC